VWNLKAKPASDPGAEALSVAGVKTLLGHRKTGDLYAMINAVCFTPDEARMLTAGDDGTVRVWDTATGKELRTIGNRQGKFKGLVLLSDGKTLVTADDSGTMQMWDMNSGVSGASVSVSGEAQNRIAATAQGVRLAAMQQNEVVLYRVTDNGMQREHAFQHSKSQPHSRLASVCFSPDGQTLVGGGDLGELEFWNVEEKRMTRMMTAHPSEAVMDLAFLGQGEVLATAGGAGIAGRAYFWDSKSAARLAEIPGHKGPVRGIAASADGRRFATLGTEDKSIIVWQYQR
jgi:WD40 repeat protein